MYVTRTKYFRFGLRKYQFGGKRWQRYLDLPYVTFHWSTK
jgi:hypothetical protein